MPWTVPARGRHGRLKMAVKTGLSKLGIPQAAGTGCESFSDIKQQEGTNHAEKA